MLEVVVIGAGVAGFSAALALWDRGAAVTLVDESRPGAAATGASAGMVVAQYEAGAPDEKFHLCVESRALYPEFAARIEELSGQQLDVRWDGMLVANLSDEEHAEAEETVRWQREVGLEAEVLDPAAAAELQPGVATDVVSYLWFPQEGQLDSQRLGAALTAAIAGTGIRLISGNGVAEVLSSDDRVTGVAMADGRTLEAERVVLSAGAWSGRIGGLPRELPVRPVRGQIARFPAKALGLERIVASHAGRYLVPRSDDTVLAGSTMEDVGYDRSITDAGLQTIYESVSRLVPALAGLKPIERWAGLRPISADLFPIIGPDPDLEGLVYATGYGRAGIVLAPVTGVMAAELTLTGDSEHDWRPFRPDRFAESS
ncbi:MAG: glycine oxidase ThiO [Gemmatimonadetes bacterium]|nr:glycine oxidase ThiO [Gemmatimonadota bacterium]NIO31385.1 glycine oxidase ThiO [Gemmatimonadota bacterium]